jgi:hypothetical protein
LALPSFGESKKWKKVWLASVAALGASNAADLHSSSGLWETNPLLRGPHGRFNARKGVLIKSIASGGLALLEVILLKKMPEMDLHKPFAITNMVVTGVVATTAVRNYHIPRKPPPPEYLRPK